MRTLFCCLTAASCLCASAQANLIENGDFEAPGGVTGWRCLSSSATGFGWSINDSIDILGAGWQPASGAQSVDLNGAWDSVRGAVFQDIGTVVGQTYYLSFAIAGNPEGGPRIKNLRIWWGNQVALIDFDATGHSVGQMGWQYYQFALTAESGITRVAFESLDTTDCGPTLDDVVVSLVPRTELTPTLQPVFVPPASPTPDFPSDGAFPGSPDGVGTDPASVQWTDNGSSFAQSSWITPDSGYTVLLFLFVVPGIIWSRRGRSISFN